MVASFLFSINLIGMDEVRARTVATTVLVAVGLYLIVVLESSSRGARLHRRRSSASALFALYVVVLSLPGWRDFFEVAAPDAGIVLCSLIGTALAAGGLALTDERFLPEWPRKTPEASWTVGARDERAVDVGAAGSLPRAGPGAGARGGGLRRRVPPWPRPPRSSRSRPRRRRSRCRRGP